MLTPMPFFYLTLAAATFAVVSRFAGGRHGSHRGRRGHRGGRAHGKGRGRSDRPSAWSFQTVFVFLTGFGVGGFFASAAGLGDVLTLTIGCLSGAALGGLQVGLMRALLTREGSSSHRADQFLGATGVVEISISAGGLGRVRCTAGSASEALLARSAGPDIPAGSAVRVVSVAGSAVTVEPVDPSEVHGPPAWRE